MRIENSSSRGTSQKENRQKKDQTMAEEERGVEEESRRMMSCRYFVFERMKQTTSTGCLESK